MAYFGFLKIFSFSFARESIFFSFLLKLVHCEPQLTSQLEKYFLSFNSQFIFSKNSEIMNF